jgi:hypothetical protein
MEQAGLAQYCKIAGKMRTRADKSIYVTEYSDN